jgi:hypothetical protein
MTVLCWAHNTQLDMQAAILQQYHQQQGATTLRQASSAALQD